MNRNFVLGALAGAIGGMLGTWALLFVDVKITIREAPALNTNLDLGAFAIQRTIAIPNPEDGEDENGIGVVVSDGFLEELVGEFQERGNVHLVLTPESYSHSSREGEGVLVSVSPVSIGNDVSRSKAKVVGFRLLDIQFPERLSRN